MSSQKESVRERLAERNEGMLFADGLDDALIGSASVWTRDGQRTVALYDYEKCVKVLMDRDGCSREDATEFLDFNTLGAFMGSDTPAFAYLDEGD